MKYTNQKIIEVMKAYKEGHPLVGICEEFGVDQYTVNNWAKKLGIKRPRQTSYDWEYIKSQI